MAAPARGRGLAAALGLLGLLPAAPPASGGEADVVSVEAAEETRGVWRFAVTVRHEDRGPR